MPNTKEMKPSQVTALRFGKFELRLDAGELRNSGLPVKLKPQPARVLALLAQRAGQPVLREELHREVWDSDTFVDFERGLNSCITQIRAVLNDDADAPRFVETLPRRGYRFIAPVEYVNGASSESIGVPAPVRARRRMGMAPALALGILTIFAALALFRPWFPSPPVPARLLVLPFENLSGDPQQEFFSDGLSEEMITQLAGMAPRQLSVIARSSAMQFKRSEKPVGEIGRELNVTYLLSGSVRRQEGRLRINAQLIRASDQSYLWAATYDHAATDWLEVQRDVSRRVAQSLALELLPAAQPAPELRASRNLTALEAYLQGRYELNRMTLAGFQKAAGHFQRAVELDPAYALAYAGLANAYHFQPWWGGLPPREASSLARAAAEKSLALDERLPEGHTALGFVRLYFDWDLAGAEKEFRHALELNPGAALSHYWLGGVLSAMGRHEESIAAMRRAQELDPLSDMINADAGWYFFHARRYDDAIRECARTLERHPQYTWARGCLTAAYRGKGMHAEADGSLAAILRGLKAPGELVEALEKSAPNARRQANQWLLTHLHARSGGYLSPYAFVMLHLDLGDTRSALAALEQAYQQRDTALTHLAVDPRLDPLRAEPQFHDLLRRMGYGSPAPGR